MKEWDSWHIMFTSKSVSLTKYKQNPNDYCVLRSQQILVLYRLESNNCSRRLARAAKSQLLFSLLWLAERVARDFKNQSPHVFISDKTMAKLHESITLKPPQFHTMCIFFDGTKQEKWSHESPKIPVICGGNAKQSGNRNHFYLLSGTLKWKLKGTRKLCR